MAEFVICLKCMDSQAQLPVISRIKNGPRPENFIRCLMFRVETRLKADRNSRASSK